MSPAAFLVFRADRLRVGAKRRVGLDDHLVGLAELGEVVDVERAEVDLHRVVDVAEVDAHLLGAHAVDVGVELRHVDVVGRVRRADARLRIAVDLAERAPDGAEERLLAEAFAVLHLELEAAGVAEAVDRRRRHDEHARALDLLDRAVDLAEDRRTSRARARCVPRRASGRRRRCPSFGAAEKPAIDRPGKATESTMPGTFSAISLMRRITASVRSSEAPAGSWAMPIRYCLSGAGTKPDGMRVKRNAVSASSTA